MRRCTELSLPLRRISTVDTPTLERSETAPLSAQLRRISKEEVAEHIVHGQWGLNVEFRTTSHHYGSRKGPKVGFSRDFHEKADLRHWTLIKKSPFCVAD